RSVGHQRRIGAHDDTTAPWNIARPAKILCNIPLHPLWILPTIRLLKRPRRLEVRVFIPQEKIREKIVAISLARCARLYRATVRLASHSSCQGGLRPPFGIPRRRGVPAPSPAGVPLPPRLNGAHRIALAGDHTLSLGGQHRAAGAALSPWAGAGTWAGAFVAALGAALGAVWADGLRLT